MVCKTLSALLVGIGVSLGAQAESPAVTPGFAGLATGILTYCGDIDRQNADQYRSMLRSIVGDLGGIEHASDRTRGDDRGRQEHDRGEHEQHDSSGRDGGAARYTQNADYQLGYDFATNVMRGMAVDEARQVCRHVVR